MSQDSGRGTVTDQYPSIETESIDRLFGAMADEGRRVAVRYLADAEGPLSRDELVHHVTVETNGCDVLEGNERERLAARFHHHHLPQLEAAGIVEYDAERGIVRGTKLADRVVEWMARL
jgi:DNA-binding transcriptional ArsR family regulator